MTISKAMLATPIIWSPSSNFNQRPRNVDVDMIVIHNISLPPGQFGTQKVQAFFCNQLDCSEHPYFEAISDLNVSSHFLIERTGVITQFVRCADRAWHAGKSSWQGVENCNDTSIGIELEGTDDIAYEDIQYDVLSALVGRLQQRFPCISTGRIVGHSQIAPGRKTDPGPAFDWNRFKNRLELVKLNDKLMNIGSVR